MIRIMLAMVATLALTGCPPSPVAPTSQTGPCETFCARLVALGCEGSNGIGDLSCQQVCIDMLQPPYRPDVACISTAETCDRATVCAFDNGNK